MWDSISLDFLPSLTMDRANLPPMLRLYCDYKDRYPDALLFFQVGDFYELFFEDASRVSRLLNLTLTSRDKSSESPIPMCGVPRAVVDGYLDRLVALGESVAVVSQVGEVDDGRRGMVERALERLITPGVRVLGGADSDSEGEVVAAIFSLGERESAIALCVPQSGEIEVIEGLLPDEVPPEVARVAPVEVVLPRVLEGEIIDRRLRWVREIGRAMRGRGAVKFRDPGLLSPDERSLNIPGYRSIGQAGKTAVKLLVNYIDEVTVSSTLQFGSVRRWDSNKFITIDSATCSHLELVENAREGGLNGTLLGTINFTNSIGGRRRLRSWILRPLRDKDIIAIRQDAVEYLNSSENLRSDLKDHLSHVADLERISSRLELAACSPRELSALRDTLERAKSISDLVLRTDPSVAPLLVQDPPLFIQNLLPKLVAPEGLSEILNAELAESPPLSLSHGGVIRDGYNPELDRLRSLRKDGSSWMSEFEVSERTRTGIASLKIKFNQVFGYFIEVTKANVDKVPEDYIPKQTTSNSQRYITTQLKDREREILGADSKILTLERQLFEDLKRKLRVYTPELRGVGNALCDLDAILSLSEYAVREQCTRPICSDNIEIKIEEGKHPVLSSIMKHQFISNSLELNAEKGIVAILTGPNMGGKSTYLKQTALLVILSQMGSFVPASSAKFGIVDQIFTRIGASDDILQGESTFMIEMRECAYILHNATKRSLLIIDEVGRGTSIVDGMSIAQAVLEWIVGHLQSRTLFATHFHHLTELEGTPDCRLQNLSVSSVDKGGEIYFTHQILSGAASRSYGIDVARLAGLPMELVSRAAELVNQAEDIDLSVAITKGKAQLSLFEQSRAKTRKVEKIVEDPKQILRRGLVDRLAKLNVNNVTPIDSLQILDDFATEARNLAGEEAPRIASLGLEGESPDDEKVH